MNKKEIELLSPAKNFEFGKIAVNFGADALYIGASKFGARKSASNSISEIEQLCNYAHKYHSKVYVALNTILYENELLEAEKMIWQIYNIGADALIIQDFGILEMNLPPIALHSSTQMHNVDYRKIQFYEKVGFTRAILARELSFDIIREIREHTSIELEVFVHGAVCVSYSGQCYMSAFMGERSGNRGECAQPCRLKYDLLDSNKNIIQKNKHLLSLKDINRSMFLEDLIDAGVQSFKIEGRLKDESYLKNVTAFYRKKLDTILEHRPEYKMTSKGKFYFGFEPLLEKTFNRRYTDYFLESRKLEMNSISPKSLGMELGIVIEKGNDYFILSASEEIKNGDGLCFFDKNGELQGFSVNKTEKNKIFFKNELGIQKGMLVFRNYDHDFIKTLTKQENCRFIPVNFIFSEIENGFNLNVSCSDGLYSVDEVLEIDKELAKNKEKAIENLKAQLSKTGDTNFIVDNIELKLNDIYFFPISSINNLRREVLTKLEKTLGTKYQRSEYKIEQNNSEYYLKELDYRANITNTLAEKFYRKHGVEKTEKGYEISKYNDSKILMNTKFCIKYNLGYCPTYQKLGQNIDIKYLKQEEKLFLLEFDCKSCEMKIKNI